MLLYGQKRFFSKSIFFFIFVLFCFSGFVIFSATCYDASLKHFSPFFFKQLFGFISGILITFVLTKVSYKKMIIWGLVFHIGVLFLLFFTLFKGHHVMGGTRWINMGFFKFQPSELAKISLPLSIVHYFFYYCQNHIFDKNWLIMLANIFFTSLLIIKQPDLGTGILVLINGLLLLFIMGLPRKIIVCGMIFFLFSCPFVWTRLHDYQKKRILVFLGHGSAHKERYQLEQSKIAIGSGGLYGKGFLKGTQKNFQFLPENRTDFIFAVVAEEFGFLGVLVIFFLYIVLFFQLFFRGKYIDDDYGYVLYQTMIFPFFIGMICNIGMVVGLLPVVGIPLPFMSYGITHVWSSAIMLGIAQSIFNETAEY
jgi:cell division protein FtsW (lipid II flippase)